MANELELVISLRDQASAQLKNIESQIQANAKSFNEASKMALGFGGAITAALGLSVAAAEKERQQNMQLSASLKNVGISYDEVKTSLDDVIQTTMKKTGIADDQQRRALNELLLVTGNYDKAINLLPVALDLAAAKQMDVASAANLLGRVTQGNTELLSRYGIEVDKNATSEQTLEIIHNKVVGSAEAMKSPFSVLKNTFSDLAETVGGTLLPAIQSIIDMLTPMIETVKKWIDEHPELTKWLVMTAGAIGTVAVGLGTVGLVLPKIIEGIKALQIVFGVLNVVMTANPIGLIVVGIGALIALIVILVKNWDTVKAAFIAAWDAIKDAFAKAFDFIKEHWDIFLSIFGGPIGAIVAQIIKHWDSIKNAFFVAWNAIKDTFFNVINFLISGFEGFINFFIRGINTIINGLNQINFSIPDWVPLIGGKSFGLNIAPIAEVSLPRMAEGGIINRPTALWAGEAGPEAIVPLNKGWSGGNQNITINIYGGDNNPAEIAEQVREELLRLQMRNANSSGITP